MLYGGGGRRHGWRLVVVLARMLRAQQRMALRSMRVEPDIILYVENPSDDDERRRRSAT
jgi:hypothetical protein